MQKQNFVFNKNRHNEIICRKYMEWLLQAKEVGYEEWG